MSAHHPGRSRAVGTHNHHSDIDAPSSRTDEHYGAIRADLPAGHYHKPATRADGIVRVTDSVVITGAVSCTNDYGSAIGFEGT